MSGQRDWTYLHAFDIADPASARVYRVGRRRSSVRDQFRWTSTRLPARRDQHHLDGIQWSPANPRSFRLEAGSRLTVLRRAGPGRR